MRLPPNFLDELRARITLSEVVGRRVRLTRSNREWKGLCPFHKEKTPSFTVNDQKGFYHCFGCGAHGDAISFLTSHDNLPFMDAVEQLAAQAGMEVPRPTPEARAHFERQRSLYDLVEAACRFFESQLAAPGGRQARDYLARRGLDDAAIAAFRLGYAPADAQALVAHLHREGFDEPAMIEAGLVRRPDDGRSPYAFFRNRVTFPVGDRRGRVVAFGARLLEGEGPKYVNSPDGPLFHKGQLLYGLDRARQAAGRGHTVIVAEGYMDVIALVRAGFEAAVAPLGTALTEAQIEELWKIVPVPVLCFDGDEAGRRAAWRAADRLLPMLRPDHSARIAFMPEGEDPDSLIGAGGPAALRPILEAALPLADLLFDRQTRAHNLETPEGRAGLKAALQAQARRIADPAVQRFYAQHFREMVDQAFPWRRPGPAGRPGRTGQSGRDGQARPGPQPRLPGARADGPFGAMVLLAVMLNHPALFDEVFEALGPVAMPDPGLDRLKQAAIAALSSDPDLDSASLHRHLSRAGHGESLDRLLTNALYHRAPFARPGGDPGLARQGWREIWRRHGEGRLRKELQEAARALETNPTDADIARWRALGQRAERDGGGDGTDYF